MTSTKHHQFTTPFKPKTTFGYITTVIRSILAYLVLSITTCMWLVILVSIYPIPWRYKTSILKLWVVISFYAFTLITKITVKTQGLENLDHPKLKDQGVVYVCNHQSTWETLTIGKIIPFQCCILKKSILNIPVFGWALRFTPYFGIDRSKPIKALKKIMKVGSKYLQQGMSIIVYPEGTRVTPFEQKPLNRGAVQLAKANNSPIIPIVHNSGFCWPARQFLIYPGTITICIGEPIFNTQNANPKQLNAQISDWMWEKRKTIEKKL